MCAVRQLFNCFILGLSLIALAGCGRTSRGNALPETPINISGSLSDFVLRTVDGRTVALSDHLGSKVILISFWATWCEPCKKEMVQLESLYLKYRNAGLIILSISMDEPETQGEVAPFVKSRGFGYPVLLDPEGEAASRYNPRRAAPFSLLIGRDQRIRWEHEGYVPGDEVKMETAIQSALGI